MKTFYVKDFYAQIFKKSLITAAGMVAMNFAIAQTNTWDGSSNNNWNVAANWSLNAVPTSAHDVVIPTGFNVTVNADAFANTLTISSGAGANVVTILGINSLKVTGLVSIGASSTGNTDKVINVGVGTLEAGSLLMTATGNDNRTSAVEMTAGTLTVTGDITMQDTDGDRNYISGAGVVALNLGGSITGGDVNFGSASVLNLNGTTAQTFGPLAGYEFGSLHINNTSIDGVKLSSAITPTIVQGDLEIQNGKLSNGGFTIALSSGDQFEMGPNTILDLTGTAGTPSLTGAGTALLDATSTVNFLGSNQTAGGFSYGHVNISGTGTTTLANIATIKGDFNITSTGLFDANNLDMTVTGNWTNNGVGFIAGTGTVIFNGTGVNTIGGSTTTTFNSLSLNKTTGSAILAQDINVNGTLGIGVNMDIATHVITLGASSPAIVSLNAGSFSATKMIVASGGGEIRKNGTTASNASYFFPVGDNTGTAEYSPASVNYTSGTFAGYVSVKIVDDKHPFYYNNIDFLSRYWTIDEIGFTGFTADVAVTYTDADIVGTEANIRLGKWDGAEPWVRFDASLNASTNTLTGTVSSFSTFTGLSALANLPVKLSNFSGSLVDKYADLKWKTSEEINSARYEMEYSNDGRNYNQIGTVQSKNSVTGSAYSFKHSGLSSGKNYYRLKMVDIDGKFQYSHVVMLTYNGSLKVLNVYPNPTTSGVTLSFDKAVKGATIQVISMEGRTMSSVSVPAGSTLMQVNMSGMIRGIYNVVYTNNGERSVQRVQKN